MLPERAARLSGATSQDLRLPGACSHEIGLDWSVLWKAAVLAGLLLSEENNVGVGLPRPCSGRALRVAGEYDASVRWV